MRWNRRQPQNDARRDPGVEIVRIANRLLQRIVDSDEETRARLLALDGRSVAFQLKGTDRSLRIAIAGESIVLDTASTSEPDVVLIGTVSDFIQLAKRQKDGSPLAAGAIEIRGDLATAQLVQDVIAEFEFDIEGWLSKYTGDIAARQLGRLGRGSLQWATKTRGVLERDIAEFLLYEIRMVPSAEEIETFARQSMALGNDVDRLDSRINRIRERRSSP